MNTYAQIKHSDTRTVEIRTKNRLRTWYSKYKPVLSQHERKYLSYLDKESTDSTFGTFYLLMKVHKQPMKTRPIVSVSGSMLERLGKWVTSYLLPIAMNTKSYIKSSLEFKKKVMSTPAPDGLLLLTADAVIMYTSINTNHAMRLISNHLRLCEATSKEKNIPAAALIEGLNILMRCNAFRFGDTYWRQLSGTAMGTPPAPSWATLFYSFHDEFLLLKYREHLWQFSRYIDDIATGWIPAKKYDDDIFNEFTHDLSQFHDLKWVVSDRSKQINFLDLTITVTKDKTIQTTIFEKKMNLNLYIPPTRHTHLGFLTASSSEQSIGSHHYALTEKTSKTNFELFTTVS